MPLREHRGVLVVVIVAIALVAYPLAYRISSEEAGPIATQPARLASQPPPTVIPAAPTLPPSVLLWMANATEHRSANGETFEYHCPPDGTFGVVWGTDTYTDDSSVCTAAVHRGVITPEGGGEVAIVIRPGLDAYEGSTRNGVTTEPYGEWGGSFRVVAP